MRRWSADSWGGFGLSIFAGLLVGMFLAMGCGWLGFVSAIGPALGLALHVGWRLGGPTHA